MKAKTTKPKAIIVCGPTGIGKTTLAIELAAAFQGEILGADSMQIYRQMDIGTAKPSPDERAEIVHHMVDIVDPDEHFDADTYAGIAFKIIMAMQERQVLPFVVGGTGLYIKSLVYGLFDVPPVDETIRARLNHEVKKGNAETLFQRLQQVDPLTADKLHPNDVYRIVRALEVFEITSLSISEMQRQHQFQEKRLSTLKLGLKMERQKLYDRIDRRVDMMISDGLLDEVKDLLATGYQSELKSMQSIGYRHMLDYLEGRLNWSQAIETLKRDTRRYAKRQFTWFRADKEIIWIDPDFTPEVREMVREFIA